MSSVLVTGSFLSSDRNALVPFIAGLIQLNFSFFAQQKRGTEEVSRNFPARAITSWLRAKRNVDCERERHTSAGRSLALAHFNAESDFISHFDTLTISRARALFPCAFNVREAGQIECQVPRYDRADLRGHETDRKRISVLSLGQI